MKNILKIFCFCCWLLSWIDLASFLFTPNQQKPSRMNDRNWRERRGEKKRFINWFFFVQMKATKYIVVDDKKLKFFAFHLSYDDVFFLVWVMGGKLYFITTINSNSNISICRRVLWLLAFKKKKINSLYSEFTCYFLLRLLLFVFFSLFLNSFNIFSLLFTLFDI